MKTSSIIWTVVVIVVLVVAGVWIWSANQSAMTNQAPMQMATTTTSTASNTTTGTTTSGPAVLSFSTNATLGNFLTASNGMTLYKYTPDSLNMSTCYGQCAVFWHPYTVSSTSAVGTVVAGISGKIGTTTRTDGTLQVTYNGMPLYFYVKDSKPGDTNGQNVGGIWFVVAP